MVGEHLPFEKMDCKTEIRDSTFSVSKEPQCESFLCYFLLHWHLAMLIASFLVQHCENILTTWKSMIF